MEAMTSSGTATVTLPTEEQILITREFDAPKHLVYEAYTTPELVRRWWTARRGAMTVAEIDLRVGGTWRYVMVAHGDFEAVLGRHRQVPPRATDPEVDLGDRHLAALCVPPALDELGRGERLVDQVLGGVELPRDEDLVIRGERHLR